MMSFSLTKKQWQQIQALYEQLAEIPPDQHEMFLQESDTEPVIKQKALQLLEISSEADTEGVTTALDSTLELLSLEVLDPQLDRYRLIDILGHGGMGQVFLAERSDEQYQQQVVVKVIRSDVMGEQTVQQFKRERQILAYLEHPNIARILDGGMTSSGQPYVVMEYIKGVPITVYCEKQQLSLKQRIALFIKLCRAVDYAHRNLVIHRDLKPRNILVTEEGEPKLLDFGIASLRSVEADARVAELTRVNRASPQYASPEQVAGQPTNVASDVYSLGIILHQLLFGVRPADGQHESGSSHSKAVKIANSQARRELNAILHSAIASNPDDRYPTVNDLILELSRFLSQQPVLAAGHSWQYRLSKFWRRNWLPTGLGIGLLIAVISGTVLVWLQSQQIKAERDAALMQQRRATAVTDLLVDAFKNADPVQTLGVKVTAEQILESGAQAVSENATAAPELLADLQYTIADIYTTLTEYESAKALATHALDLREGGDTLKVAESQVQLAHVHYYGSYDFKAAKPLLEQALIELKQHPPSEALYDATFLMAFVHGNQGEHMAAVDLLWEGLRGRQQLLGESHPDSIQPYIFLGQSYRLQRDPGRAESVLREGLTKSSSDNPEHQRFRAGILRNLSELLANKGEYAEAVEAARESAEIRENIFGSEHAEAALGLLSLAKVMDANGQYQEALPILEKAEQVIIATYGTEDIRAAMVGETKANILLHLGRTDEALLLASADLELLIRLFNPDHVNVASAHAQLANIYEVMGQGSEMEYHLQRRSEILEKVRAQRTGQ